MGTGFQAETLVFFSSCCNGEVAEDFTLVSGTRTTHCFLPPTSSSNKRDWREHHESPACILSSEEISPTKFP